MLASRQNLETKSNIMDEDEDDEEEDEAEGRENYDADEDTHKGET